MAHRVYLHHTDPWVAKLSNQLSNPNVSEKTCNLCELDVPEPGAKAAFSRHLQI